MVILLSTLPAFRFKKKRKFPQFQRAIASTGIQICTISRLADTSNHRAGQIAEDLPTCFQSLGTYFHHGTETMISKVLIRV